MQIHCTGIVWGTVPRPRRPRPLSHGRSYVAAAMPGQLLGKAKGESTVQSVGRDGAVERLGDTENAA
eukprot:scaffold197907_cov17-Tisochrysis_lutea.AAC.1